MTARTTGAGRPLRALLLLGVGLVGYAIGRAPGVIEQIRADTAVIAAADHPERARRVRVLPAQAVAVQRVAVASQTAPAPSFPRKREPISQTPTSRRWVPAFAGMTEGRARVLRPNDVVSVAPSQPTPTSVADLPPAPSPAVLTAAAPAAPAPTPAFDRATAAYAALARHDRRSAAREFDAALAADPAAANAPLWRAEAQRLRRRWSGEAWTLLRDGGPALAAASPVLGGGQWGANLAYSLDPLGARPVSIIARAAVPNQSAFVRPIDLSQFAVGVDWQPVRGVHVSAERLIAGGPYARNDFALRLAAGRDGGAGRWAWSGYAEAGVIGVSRGDAYAGGQARAGWRGPDLGPLSWSAGAGAWGSAQWSGVWVSRLDAGPSLTARLPFGRGTLSLAADYRFRLRGNADPGSGPALTVSTAF